MGLFDFFKRGKNVPPPDPEPELANKKVGSLGKKASDKRAQGYDRDEAMRSLLAIGTHEAAIALLKRFSLKVDPSITDQEEKDFAYEAIVSIGRGERSKRVSDAGKDEKKVSTDPLTNAELSELRDAVVDGTRDYCDRIDNLNWPLKVMRALLDDTDYEQELLDLLLKWDTEYTRNIEPKLNVLAAMEAIKSDEIREAVHEYLEDMNETVRFHAVQTTFAQGNPDSLKPLVAFLQDEESVRIKNKVCEGVNKARWKIPAALREDWKEGMRDVYEWKTTSDGLVKKAD